MPRACRHASRVTELDAALNRLSQSLHCAGLSDFRRPAATGFLEDAIVRVAPLRLPRELRDFWASVDPLSLPLESVTTPLDQASALTLWQEARGGAAQPLTLLPLGYSQQMYLGIELETASRASDGLYSWDAVDGGFELRYRTMADWIATICDLLDDGAFAVDRITTSEGQQNVAVLDWERERALADLRLRASVPEEAKPFVPRDPASWPEHWRAGGDPHR